MTTSRLALLAAVATLSACATLPPDQPSDPLEPVNRAMFSFNRGADRYVLKPVAKGYKAVVPDVAQKGVINFFSNLSEPITIVNGVLQGKFLQATSDTGRFLLNSTAGFAGLMDVATKAGLPRHDEDFGQTLGYWGVGTGAYLMLPFFGPSNGRDLIGRGADYFTNPLYYVQQNNSDEDWVFYGATAVNLVSTRTQLLSADSLLDGAIDPYIFLRTAYLQNRLNKVYDGSPPKALLYGIDDDE
ncbi:MAG: VacJ family lipoprotein [Stagnimonas sp.]|nr:VacJ family lipoprotein [Stagnimonas sp.]